MIPINLPPEAKANPEIASLWIQYQALMNNFKETHKLYSQAKHESLQFKELRTDIGIIDSEKENGIIKNYFFCLKLKLLSFGSDPTYDLFSKITWVIRKIANQLFFWDSERSMLPLSLKVIRLANIVDKEIKKEEFKNE